MIDLSSFYQLLGEEGVGFVTGVPDTLLNDFCLGLEAAWPENHHIIAANEGNAVALAAGYHLATGSVPLVYMQNSGLGNAMNPLISLVDPAVYSIPMVLLIGWRGESGSGDWPQHERQGELTPVLLNDLRIPHRTLHADEAAVAEATQWALRTARETQRPTALLVRKGVLAKKEKAGFDADQAYQVSREQAIDAVLNSAPANSLFVATTGRATRELHALRELRGEPHDQDFLNVGAMGHALSIATGIAVAKPRRTVICLDGDGATIMHLGSLLVSARSGLPNLLHIVLNNGAHESVGGQATAGFSADLARVASAAGYRTAGPLSTVAELIQAVVSLAAEPHPGFIEMRIRKGMRTDMPVLRCDLASCKASFMRNTNMSVSTQL